MQLYHVCREYGIVLAAGCLFSLPVYSLISDKLSAHMSVRATEMLKDVVMVILFAACFVRLVVSSYNPFIYFRF